MDGAISVGLPVTIGKALLRADQRRCRLSKTQQGSVTLTPSSLEVFSLQQFLVHSKQPHPEYKKWLIMSGGPHRPTALSRQAHRGNYPSYNSEIDVDSPMTDPRYSGRVLGPSPCGSRWWDSKCFSGAVVVPPAIGMQPSSSIAQESVVMLEQKGLSQKVFPHADTSGKRASSAEANVNQPAGQVYNKTCSNETNEITADQEGGCLQVADSHWRMYYYGRNTDSWSKGVQPPPGGVPTGRIGLATSQDGIMWERFQGPLEGGAIFDPSDDMEAFDAVQVAVSDVIRLNHNSGSEQVYWGMFYLGSGMEEGEVPGVNGKFKGVRIRPGFAKSEDGVTQFERRGTPILELGAKGEFDELGIAWPRVVPPSPTGRSSEKAPWLITYHTRERGSENEPPCFSVGAATSSDGHNWVKHGRVLSKGARGSWDEGGVSVRSVLPIDDKYVMFYEGSDFQFNFSIGLATSADGLTWDKATDAGPEPGGPILSARKGEDVWDNIIVGTPYVVAMPDGSFWMYYLGVGKLVGKELRQGIGLAVSDGKDYRKWSRYPVA